mgnify:CR=1 FL=1
MARLLVNTEKLSLETSNPERRYCAATSTATTTHARHKYLLRLCSCRQANRLPLFRCASMLKRVELNSDEVTESRPRQSQIQVLSPYRPYPYPGPYQGNKDFGIVQAGDAQQVGPGILDIELDGEVEQACVPGQQVDPADIKRCQTCPSGKFSQEKDQTACTGVSGGFRSINNRTAQEKCPALHVSAEGADSCVLCGDGYIPNKGQSECTPCGPGKYSTSTMCIACPPGTVQPDGGTGDEAPMTAEVKASLGYRSGVGCKPCQLGFFPSPALDTCEKCKGKASDVFQIAQFEGTTECVDCAPPLICKGFRVAGVQAKRWINWTIADMRRVGGDLCIANATTLPDAARCLHSFPCIMSGCNGSALIGAGASNSTWLSPDENGTAQCNEGYQGLLCATCDGDRFRLKQACTACPSLALMIGALSFAVFLLSVLVYVLFNSEPKQSFFITKYKASI